jgi:hypothetical protein
MGVEDFVSFYFKIGRYECVWIDGPPVENDDERRPTGGFVSIHIADTGDLDVDWSESDVIATSVAEAHQIAQKLIFEWEDA